MAVQALSALHPIEADPFTYNTLFSKQAAKTAFRAVENYQLAYQRARALHKEINGTKPAGSGHHAGDQTLLNPVQFRSKTIRRLIKCASIFEEIGEASADASSMIERFTRHCISGGDKTDLAKIAAAGTGRVVSSQLTFGVAGVNKMVACGCMFTSCMLSIIALSLSKTKLGARRSEEEIRQALANGEGNLPELYPFIARNLEKAKGRALREIERWAKPLGGTAIRRLRFLKERLSRNTSDSKGPAASRQLGTNYMWNNRHQYSRLVRALLHTANVIFTVVNKAFCSYDKHLGVFMGQKILARRMGRTLGTRIALTVMYGVAAVAAYFLSHTGFSLSTMGACACGLAFLLILAAKAQIAVGHGWLGDCKKPVKPFRPLAR